MVGDTCMIVVRTENRIELFREVYDWWKKDGCIFICYLYKDFTDGTLEPKMKHFNLDEVEAIETF